MCILLVSGGDFKQSGVDKIKCLFFCFHRVFHRDNNHGRCWVYKTRFHLEKAGGQECQGINSKTGILFFSGHNTLLSSDGYGSRDQGKSFGTVKLALWVYFELLLSEREGILAEKTGWRDSCLGRRGFGSLFLTRIIREL